MAAKLTWDQAARHIGDEARLTMYLGGDSAASHPNFDLALPIADGIIRSRITTRYTPESYDALTAETIPPYVQFYLFCMLLGVATSHDEARAAAIDKYAGVCAGWLDDIESGKAKIAELTEIASPGAGATGGVAARVGATKKPLGSWGREVPL